jgi:hypothetical protein
VPLGGPGGVSPLDAIPPPGGSSGVGPFLTPPCRVTVDVMEESTLELASFRGDDDPSLVAAALACRACLSGDVEWSLRVDDFDGEVECRCRSCGYVREVSLTSEQALRLSLQPA